MTNRRDFLKRGAAATAGVVFCTCGMQHAAQAQWAGAPDVKHHRLPIMLNGKRVKTIDVHAHCFFQKAIDPMGVPVESFQPHVKGVKEHFIPESDKAAVEGRLKAMDAMGIDMEVLSVNPYWYDKDRDLAAKIVELNNDGLAELTHAHPDRFAAFATLALQFPDLAVQQLEDAVRNKGLKGAAIGGHVNGDEHANPKFDPVWAKAEELGATLFIHPQSTPQLAPRFKGNGWMTNTVGNPLDTTLALEHLIFQGTLDKFPRLKIIAAHGGGYLPSYSQRINHPCYISPEGCDPSIKLQKTPTEYLKQMYYDVLVFDPESLRHLMAVVGPSQLMLGTDHPIPWEEHPVDLIFESKFLSDKQRLAIMHDNASRLLDIHLASA